jgi:hypothetical protein
MGGKELNAVYAVQYMSEMGAVENFKYACDTHANIPVRIFAGRQRGNFGVRK